MNFFTRPSALILLALILLSVFSQTGLYRRLLGKLTRK